jgi:hypothetical protein
MRVVLWLGVIAGCNDECLVDGVSCVNEIAPRVYTAIAAGSDHTCAKASFIIDCWGDGAAPGRGRDVIRAGGEVTCGLDLDTKSLWCTANDSVLYGYDNSFVDFDVSETHGCGIRDDGRVICWDFEERAPDARFETIAVGSGHNCGVVAGMPSCWGRNEVGQSSAPLRPMSAVYASDGYSCGLDTGAIVCWGAPPAPAPAGAFVELALAKTFACGVRADRTIACWGDPTDGRTSPPSGSFIAIAVGDAHACAIDTAGAATCWGADNVGQATPPR